MREIPQEKFGSMDLSLGAFWKDSRKSLSGFLRRASVLSLVPSGGSLVAANAVLRRSGPSIEISAGLDELPGKKADSARALRLVLPRRSILAKDLVLPASDPAELAGMVAFEIASLFPVPPQDLTWTSFPLEVTSEGYTRLRVLAVETDLLEEALSDLALSERIDVAAEPSTVSLANLLFASRGGWPEDTVALVALWDDNIDFAVVGPDGLCFDRGVAASSESPSKSEVAGQVAASLAMCAESGFPDVSQIVVAATSLSEDLKRSLEEETGLPVETFSPPSFIPSVESQDGASFIAAGAALSGLLSGGIHAPLVPARVVDRAESASRSRAVILTALLALFVIFLAWGALALRADRLSSLVDRLNARADEISPEASKITAKEQRLSAIKRQLSGRGAVLDILLALYRITPADISLTSVELSEKGLLTIKGHAQQMYRASEYARLLDEETAFGLHLGVRSHQRTESGKVFIYFTINRDRSEGM